MKKSTLIAIMCAGMSLVPFAALAQQTVGDVFTCDRNSASSLSAGSTRPLSGPYVPVADDAVQLNTGLLVYKECVLKGIVVAKRKAGLATVDQQVLTKYNSGDGGNPTFGGFPSRELGKEEVQLSDKTYLRYLQNDSLSGFNDTLEGTVKQGLARGYSAARDPRKDFVCSYQGNLTQAYTGVPTGDYWTAFNALSDDPACNVFEATTIAYDALDSQTAYELYKNRERLDWGDGTYDLAHFDEFGFRITDTQGQIVLQQGIQSIQSPYVQARNADDISEMMDGLYLGVTNQVLTAGNPGTTNTGGTTTGGSAGGLNAITQALNGALSYIGQVVQSQTQGYVNTTGNAALGVLQSALATERQYNAAVTSTANLFTQSIASLRAKELQCYSLITEAVCQPGTLASSTCTGVSGGTLTITRSTGFSQKVIDANIRPLATATVTNLNSSNQIIASLQALIAGLTANSTQVAQAAALASMAAINPHNAGAVSTATANQQNSSTLMANLINNTATAWSESTDLATGWCNINNQPVKDAWTSCWSGGGSCPTP